MWIVQVWVVVFVEKFGKNLKKPFKLVYIQIWSQSVILSNDLCQPSVRMLKTAEKYRPRFNGAEILEMYRVFCEYSELCMFLSWDFFTISVLSTLSYSPIIKRVSIDGCKYYLLRCRDEFRWFDSFQIMRLGLRLSNMGIVRGLKRVELFLVLFG